MAVVCDAVFVLWIGVGVLTAAYAETQKRRGLLSDAIVAHAVTNAPIIAQVLLAGHWSLWWRMRGDAIRAGCALRTHPGVEKRD